MNKYAIIGIVLVAILGAGTVYKLTTDNDDCTTKGKDVFLNVVSKKLEWRFEPETITVEKCDRVEMIVSNEDNFDHGVEITALGVSQRLPSLGQINVKFVASKAGEFPFFCSVSCSGSDNASFALPDGKVAAGPYAGKFRDHFLHIGKFIVNGVQGQ